MRIAVEKSGDSSFLFHWLAFFSRYYEFVFRFSTPVKICLFFFSFEEQTILFMMLSAAYSIPSKRFSKMSPSFMMKFTVPCFSYIGILDVRTIFHYPNLPKDFCSERHAEACNYRIRSSINY